MEFSTRLKNIVLIILLFFISLLACKSSFAYQISYKFTVPDSPQKPFDIEIMISDIKSKKIDLMMPNWQPGEYPLNDYSKNVKNFVAASLNNKLLKSDRVNTQTWRIYPEKIPLSKFITKLLAV